MSNSMNVKMWKENKIDITFSAKSQMIEINKCINILCTKVYKTESGIASPHWILCCLVGILYV